MENVLNRHQVLVLFTAVASFMEELCWGPARDSRHTWVPESQATLDTKAKEKAYGKTRIAMNKAAAILARCEIGKGITPNEVTHAYAVIKNWKVYFVQNMKDKQNIQLAEQCRNRIRLAIRAGKNLACDHNDKHLLGQHGAAALADNIFRMVYDSEVRALQENGLSTYFGREPGPVEFGEDTSGAEFLPRQFAEQPQGEFYRASEDEHATGWSMSNLTEINSSDDEHVETEFGNSLVVDYNSRNEKYGDMRRLIMKAKNQDQREKLVKQAENMAKLEIIADWQARALRYWSFQVASYRIAEFRGKLSTQKQKDIL